MVREAAYKGAKKNERIKATFRTKLKENDKRFGKSSKTKGRIAAWRAGEGPPPTRDHLVNIPKSETAVARESVKKEFKELKDKYAASGKMKP